MHKDRNSYAEGVLAYTVTSHLLTGKGKDFEGILLFNT